jgi:cell division transport system permease protein
MRALRYAFDEALTSIWRGRPSGLLSMMTIALALFVLGGFLLVTTNLERLGAGWSSSAEMSVYLAEEVGAAERDAIERTLSPGPIVEAREFVSKDQALVRFKQTFGDLASAIDTAGGNPLPASYEVRLRTGGGVEPGVDELATRVRQMAGVSDVRYDRQWLDRVLAAIRVIRVIGFLLASLLTLAAALTVANVVRLGLNARRDELDIMQLVGAPQTYVRGPFLMEGVLQGGLGALVALIALSLSFLVVRAWYIAPLASAIDVSSVGFLSVGLCVVLVVGGMVVGCAGGVVAAWGRSGSQPLLTKP